MYALLVNYYSLGRDLSGICVVVTYKIA